MSLQNHAIRIVGTRNSAFEEVVDLSRINFLKNIKPPTIEFWM